MKNVVAFLFLFELIYPSESRAQLLKSYGFKLAYTLADQKFNYSNGLTLDTKKRTGINVGAYVEWLDIPSFSLITQIEYCQRGTGIEFAQTGNDPTVIGYFTYYSRLDYVSVPVFLKLSLPTELVSPYILAGPRIDFLLGYEAQNGINSIVYQDFKKTVVGGSFALGIESASLLPIHVMAETRFNVDLMDSYTSENLSVRNTSFDIWLGVGF